MNINDITDAMHQKELDTLLVIKTENITYLSKYKPSSFSVLIVKDDAILYTSKLDIGDASNNSQIPVAELKSFDEIKSELEGTVGIENSMPLSTYRRICKDKEIKINEIIESFRIIKSPEEVKNIQKSIKIAENSLSNINLQGTEDKVAADLEYNMKSNGSIKPAFETIIASGIRSSIPHATISSEMLESPIVIDWGAVYNNYCSDITRTFIESEKQREIFNIVKDAQKEAIKVIKPGIKASYVDKIARGVIAEYGYEDNFIHSTGHGLGLEVHEDPTLSTKSDFKLQKGMVITIEPGIYLEGEFGVRIEDDILIKNRAKILTSYKKDGIK